MKGQIQIIVSHIYLLNCKNLRKLYREDDNLIIACNKYATINSSHKLLN